MVMAYHRKWVPLDRVRVACGVSRDGTNAYNIVMAAQAYGMTWKAKRYDVQALQQELDRPAILHWNNNHFVVLRGFTCGKAVLCDPARGRVRVPIAELERSYSNLCIVLEPGEGFTTGGKHRGSLRHMREELRGKGGTVAVVALAGILAAFAEVLEPQFVRLLTDDVLDWDTGTLHQGLLWLYDAIVAFHLVASLIDQSLNKRVTGKMAANDYASKPEDPTKGDHTFLGWYEDLSQEITPEELEEYKAIMSAITEANEVDDDDPDAAKLREAYEEFEKNVTVIDGKVMDKYDPSAEPVQRSLTALALWSKTQNEPTDAEGALRTEVVRGDDAPKVTAGNLEEVAREALTADEETKDVVVRLVVNRIDKSVAPAEDRQSLEEALAELGADAEQWLDITLVKVVDGVETRVTELKTALQLSVEVPQDMRGQACTYYLLRGHNGDASTIASDSSTTLTGESGLFSTYVIARANTNQDEPTTDPEGSKPADTPEDTPADTGQGGANGGGGQSGASPADTSQGSASQGSASASGSDRGVTTRATSAPSSASQGSASGTSRSLASTGDPLHGPTALFVAAIALIAVALKLRFSHGG